MASLNEMINLHQYKYGRPQGGQSAFGVIADMLGQEAKIRQEKQAQIEEENRQLERAQRLQKLFNTADEQASRVNTDLEKADRSTDNPRVGASVVNIPKAAMSMASGGIGDAFGNPIPYSSQVAAQPQDPTVIPSRSQRYSLEPDISMAGGKMNVGVKLRDNLESNDALQKELAVMGVDPSGMDKKTLIKTIAQKKAEKLAADDARRNTPVEDGFEIVGYDQNGFPMKRKIATKPPTEGQSRDALFGQRMLQANDVFDKNEKYINNLPVVGTAINEMSPNFVKSSGFQVFDQAKRNFLNAVLRKESGAVISPTEFANGDLQYFPQPGDKPEVLAQKKANRELAIENMRRSSGVAWSDNGLESGGGVPSVGQMFNGEEVINVQRIE